MRTLPTAITDEAASSQQAWAELFDFYLKEAITTPWGTSNVIRITALPGGLSFFTPTNAPEPVATQGDAATYEEWPVKRKPAKSSTKFANDKIAILASNVTSEFAGMVTSIDWKNVLVVIREISQEGSTSATDAVTVFSGWVDSIAVSDKNLTFYCSSDMAVLNYQLPNESFHANCRARFGDDICGVILLRPENTKHKTITTGSTATRLKATYAGYSAQAVTVDNTTDKITLATHTLLNGHRVRFSATAMPGGLTEGQWYYVVNKATNDFQVSETYGGSVVPISSNGTSVTITTETGFTEDTGTAPWLDEAVTADAGTDKITLNAHGLANGDRVKLGGTAVPGGLTAGVWYYVVNKATNDFQVALTYGGGAIDLTSAGTSVTLTSSAPYGTDEVNALADGAITTSSEQTGYEGYQVKRSKAAANHWRFASDPSNPTPSMDLLSPFLNIDFGAAQNVAKWRITNAPVDDPSYNTSRRFDIYYSSDGVSYAPAASGVSAPPPNTRITNVTEVTITHPIVSARYWRIIVRYVSNGRILDAVVGKVYAYATATGTTDLINPLANGAFTASNEKTGNEAYYVQSGVSGSWKLDAPSGDEFNVYDWGNNYQGYWQIRDSQAGLKNAALEPYIQFDFGSAKALKLWRLKALDDVERQDIPKVIEFFSSADAASWTFQAYFQMPPQAGGTFDCLIPGAASARYWRICVRSTWADLLNFKLFNKVEAYTLSRNWWADGLVTFAADTTTAALRGVTRPVRRSFANLIEVDTLPVAPAAGDRFLVQKGCNRSFNACAERQNIENFAGFDTLPGETVVRG